MALRTTAKTLNESQDNPEKLKLGKNFLMFPFFLFNLEARLTQA